MGKYRLQVANGISFLAANQSSDGSFGKVGYQNAIATMAVCEAYGMTRSPSLKDIAQKAVDNITRRQNSGFGWNYGGPNPRNDTSVTGWQVMALKSAKSSGLNVNSSFKGVKNFLEKVTPPIDQGPVPELKGDVAYTYHSGTGALGHRNDRLTAIGCLCRVFIGEDTQGDMLRAHGNTMLNKLPAVSDNMDFYRWYYATLAMFQMGGSYWKTWNEALKKALCESQCKGGCADGSWDPNVAYGDRGGRVFSTAIGCLSLEIYYRYGRMPEEVKNK
jgi:hypothetical protein